MEDPYSAAMWYSQAPSYTWASSGGRNEDGVILEIEYVFPKALSDSSKDYLKDPMGPSLIHSS